AGPAPCGGGPDRRQDRRPAGAGPGRVRGPDDHRRPPLPLPLLPRLDRAGHGARRGLSVREAGGPPPLPQRLPGEDPRLPLVFHSWPAPSERPTSQGGSAACPPASPRGCHPPPGPPPHTPRHRRPASSRAPKRATPKTPPPRRAPAGPTPSHPPGTPTPPPPPHG